MEGGSERPNEPAAKQSLLDADLKITNWVCTGVAACQPFHLFGKGENFFSVPCFKSAVKVKLPNSRAVCLYFLKSKKFVYSGAKSEFEAFENLCEIFSGSDNILELRTTNIVAICNIGSQLILRKVYDLLLNDSIECYISFEPELFSAIVYRPDRKQSGNFNIFSTGRMVLCGFNNFESLKLQLRNVLLKFATHLDCLAGSDMQQSTK